jgi:hypothetical protein
MDDVAMRIRVQRDPTGLARGRDRMAAPPRWQRYSAVVPSTTPVATQATEVGTRRDAPSSSKRPDGFATGRRRLQRHSSGAVEPVERGVTSTSGFNVVMLLTPSTLSFARGTTPFSRSAPGYS